uniref:Uncharacterized protein n=1 Tax=Rhizophora mucronata TaxID=61149 RepID=A0A2P2R410_RHIMU
MINRNTRIKQIITYTNSPKQNKT